MNPLLVISGIKLEYEGLRDQSLADLRVYLQAPVGVGGHSTISEDVKAKLKKIDRYDSILATMEKYIQVQEQPEGEEGQTAEKTPVKE